MLATYQIKKQKTQGREAKKREENIEENGDDMCQRSKKHKSIRGKNESRKMNHLP